MHRFNDPLLLEVLNTMKTFGGKKISEDRWQKGRQLQQRYSARWSQQPSC